MSFKFWQNSRCPRIISLDVFLRTGSDSAAVKPRGQQTVRKKNREREGSADYSSSAKI